MPKALLLADDSVTIQKVVGISFASEDVTLTTVDNGDDAISRTREQRPDLVLADVVMPGKSGYEVCEAIKADPELRHIPVLLLTGTFEAFDEERARQVGAAGHVAKPFEAQTLVDKVNELLSAGAIPAAPELEATTSVVEKTGDDAFDFFAEDLTPSSPVDSLTAAPITPPAPPAAPPLAEAGDPLNIDAPLELAEAPNQDDAFSFGDDAFASIEAEPAPLATDLDFDDSVDRFGGEVSPDSTVAILPGSDDLWGSSSSSDIPTLSAELVEPEYAAPGEDLLFDPSAPPVSPLAAPADGGGTERSILQRAPRPSRGSGAKRLPSASKKGYRALRSCAWERASRGSTSL